MSKAPEATEGEPLSFDFLTASKTDAATLEEQFQTVRQWRRRSPQLGDRLDRFFVDELGRLRNGLGEAQKVHRELAAHLDLLTASPWHSALFVRTVDGRDHPSALVLYNGARRLVSIAEGVDLYDAAVGDEVLLSNTMNTIMAVSSSIDRSGGVATFDRYTADGRLVVRSRDEEVVVDAPEPLLSGALKRDDLVRWNEHARIALERLDRPSGEEGFLETMPVETFAQIGGLDRQIERLQRSIRLHLYHADVVQEYGLRRKGSVLLVGPPGTGKTMLAKALANWVGRISRSGRSRFINVKPAALHSMWYGKTEENYRQAFRAAREAGAAEPDVPVVMFFDEIDAIGSIRGASLTRTDDRVLNAFMTELDGLEARGNVLVVAATNRRDALDPALLRPGRLGDLELEVPRPTLATATDILGKYMPPQLRYAIAGRTETERARRDLVDAAISQMYAPNADNRLATLTLRDGRQRVVRAADLMNGASLAKIAGDAIERAGLRRIEAGDPAICLDDVQGAIAEELQRLAFMLTPASCRYHLTGSPDELDVVRVEPVRRVGRQHRYTRIA